MLSLLKRHTPELYLRRIGLPSAERDVRKEWMEAIEREDKRQAAHEGLGEHPQVTANLPEARAIRLALNVNPPRDEVEELFADITHLCRGLRS